MFAQSRGELPALAAIILRFYQVGAKGSCHQFVHRLGRVALIIIEDWGLHHLTAAGYHGLIEPMGVSCE